MVAAVETMFYAGEVPWHGLGRGVEKAKTSKEAIKLAGLNWKVKTGPLWGGADKKGEAKPIPNMVSIYRETDGRVFGTASEAWEPWQNQEGFDFLDSLLADGIITYETAGALFDGRKVWMLAKLEKGMKVAGDEYWNYMLLSMGHDGNSAIRILPTQVRVVCNNTLTSALMADKGHIKVIHQTKSMRTKLAQAKEALSVTTGAHATMQTFLKHSAATKVGPKGVLTVQEALFGSLDDETPKQRREAIERFKAVYWAEKERSGATAYALVNAITGYADHEVRYLGTDDEQAERRLVSTTGAWSTNYHTKALEIKRTGLAALNEVAPKLKLAVEA
jgi:phage/plasmid-like protein (TIGR03299 family)